LHFGRMLEEVEELTDKVMFLFGWGPEEVGRMSSLLYLVETASDMNFEVSVFLYAEGVVLARANAAEKLDPDIKERLERLLGKASVRFYACSEAAHKRAISQSDLAPSISMMGYAAFLDKAVQAKAVITV
jgi:predicted peroxiredoxin